MGFSNLFNGFEEDEFHSPEAYARNVTEMGGDPEIDAMIKARAADVNQHRPDIDMADLQATGTETPKASAPVAANDGEGFNWQRALTALFDGNEGVKAYDTRKAGKAETARRSRLDEIKLKQDTEAHNLGMAGKRQANAKGQLELDTATEANNPASEYSKAMREGIAQRLGATASIVAKRDPQTAKLLQSAAENMRNNQGLSALRAISAAEQFGDIGKQAISESHNLAQEALSRASLGETRRMHDATIDNMKRDDARAEDKEITIKNSAQEKLNKDVNDKQQAVENMEEIGKLKGNVNTGFITALWSKWVGKPFDFNTSDRNELEALLARTFNRETKELAGSAVSAAEWARIEPQIPQASDDDNVFKQKLAMAMKTANEILAKRKQEYQLGNKGKSLDQSRTGQRASAEGSAAADAVEGKTPAGADQAKVARAKQIISDPNESPEKKAKAERWLAAHAQ